MREDILDADAAAFAGARPDRPACARPSATVIGSLCQLVGRNEAVDRAVEIAPVADRRYATM